ncbi:MAG: hypothetical protein R3A45_00610 [Bdellovibrionota bacterium]
MSKSKSNEASRIKAQRGYNLFVITCQLLITCVIYIEVFAQDQQEEKKEQSLNAQLLSDFTEVEGFLEPLRETLAIDYSAFNFDSDQVLTLPQRIAVFKGAHRELEKLLSLSQFPNLSLKDAQNISEGLDHYLCQRSHPAFEGSQLVCAKPDYLENYSENAHLGHQNVMPLLQSIPGSPTEEKIIVALIQSWEGLLRQVQDLSPAHKDKILRRLLAEYQYVKDGTFSSKKLILMRISQLISKLISYEKTYKNIVEKWNPEKKDPTLLSIGKGVDQNYHNAMIRHLSAVSSANMRTVKDGFLRQYEKPFMYKQQNSTLKNNVYLRVPGQPKFLFARAGSKLPISRRANLTVENAKITQGIMFEEINGRDDEVLELQPFDVSAPTSQDGEAKRMVELDFLIGEGGEVTVKVTKVGFDQKNTHALGELTASGGSLLAHMVRDLFPYYKEKSYLDMGEDIWVNHKKMLDTVEKLSWLKPTDKEKFFGLLHLRDRTYYYLLRELIQQDVLHAYILAKEEGADYDLAVLVQQSVDRICPDKAACSQLIHQNITNGKEKTFKEIAFAWGARSLALLLQSDLSIDTILQHFNTSLLPSLNAIANAMDDSKYCYWYYYQANDAPNKPLESTEWAPYRAMYAAKTSHFPGNLVHTTVLKDKLSFKDQCPTALMQGEKGARILYHNVDRQEIINALEEVRKRLLARARWMHAAYSTDNIIFAQTHPADEAFSIFQNINHGNLIGGGIDLHKLVFRLLMTIERMLIVPGHSGEGFGLGHTAPALSKAVLSMPRLGTLLYDITRPKVMLATDEKHQDQQTFYSIITAALFFGPVALVDFEVFSMGASLVGLPYGLYVAVEEYERANNMAYFTEQLRTSLAGQLQENAMQVHQLVHAVSMIEKHLTSGHMAMMFSLMDAYYLVFESGLLEVALAAKRQTILGETEERLRMLERITRYDKPQDYMTKNGWATKVAQLPEEEFQQVARILKSGYNADDLEELIEYVRALEAKVQNVEYDMVVLEIVNPSLAEEIKVMSVSEAQKRYNSIEVIFRDNRTRAIWQAAPDKPLEAVIRDQAEVTASNMNVLAPENSRSTEIAGSVKVIQAIFQVRHPSVFAKSVLSKAWGVRKLPFQMVSWVLRKLGIAQAWAKSWKAITNVVSLVVRDSFLASPRINLQGERVLLTGKALMINQIKVLWLGPMGWFFDMVGPIQSILNHGLRKGFITAEEAQEIISWIEHSAIDNVRRPIYQIRSETIQEKVSSTSEVVMRTIKVVRTVEEINKPLYVNVFIGQLRKLGLVQGNLLDDFWLLFVGRMFL